MGLFGSSSSPSAVQSTSSGSSSARAPPPELSSGTTSHTSSGTLGGKPLALSDLRPDTLYLMLYSRGVGRKDNFHWGLYHHENTAQGGTKFHIKNPGSDGRSWITDHGTTKGAVASMALIGLMRIANVNPTNKNAISSIIRQDDLILSSLAGLSCRVWVLAAMERLRQGGYLRFTGLQELEREALDFGNRYERSTVDAFQPRPLVDSKVCII